MNKCKNCGHRLHGCDLEEPERESETTPGYCVACADHLAEQAEYRAYLRDGGETATLNTHESHDPNEWAWS